MVCFIVDQLLIFKQGLVVYCIIEKSKPLSIHYIHSELSLYWVSMVNICTFYTEILTEEKSCDTGKIIEYKKCHGQKDVSSKSLSADSVYSARRVHRDHENISRMNV